MFKRLISFFLLSLVLSACSQQAATVPVTAVPATTTPRFVATETPDSVPSTPVRTTTSASPSATITVTQSMTATPGITTTRTMTSTEEITATRSLTVPTPILGAGPVYSGLAAAIVPDFRPGEPILARLQGSEGDISTDQIAADPYGGVLVARWISEGPTEPLSAGTYTYTLTGGDQTQTLTFQVAEPPAELPAYIQTEAVSCRVTPDAPRMSEYAILWCWGNPVDGFVTLRISDGRLSQEIPNKAVDHIVVYPLQLTPDGLHAGTWTFELLVDGDPVAAISLEIR